MNRRKIEGIVIVAAQKPYYGRMAYNLALSIRAAESAARIAVIHNGNGLAHLTDEHKKIFDRIIKIEDSITGVEAKLSVYEATPYEYNVYIDADNIWLPGKKISDLFKLFSKEVVFSGITEGQYTVGNPSNNFGNYVFWANPDDIAKSWKLKEGTVMYQWRSELFYFQKALVTRRMFSIAKKAFKEPKVDVSEFAKGVPDEFAFNVATALTGIKPHVENWQPSFWANVVPRNSSLKDISVNHWILSTGGNVFPKYVKTMYDNIIAVSSNKLRQQLSFPLLPKSYFLNERYKH